MLSQLDTACQDLEARRQAEPCQHLREMAVTSAVTRCTGLQGRNGTCGMLCCVMPADPLPSAPDDAILLILTERRSSCGERKDLGMPTRNTAAHARAGCEPSTRPANSCQQSACIPYVKDAQALPK